MSKNQDRDDVVARAAAWRAAHPGHEHGVVVFYAGEVVGWMNALRDPSHWEPGCLAVDALGQFWEATGGDSRLGARSWVPVRMKAGVRGVAR